jgi:hypothetical protein
LFWKRINSIATHNTILTKNLQVFSYNFPNASMWFIWAHLYRKDRSISFSSSDNNYTTIYQNTRKLIRPRIYISKSYQVKINLPRSFCIKIEVSSIFKNKTHFSIFSNIPLEKDVNIWQHNVKTLITDFLIVKCSIHFPIIFTPFKFFELSIELFSEKSFCTLNMRIKFLFIIA